MILKQKSLIAGMVASLSLVLAPAHAADLLQVYQEAQERDPQIRRAEAEFRSAREIEPQARSALLPQLDAGAGISRSDTNPSNNPSFDFRTRAYEITLNQSIYDHSNYVALRQARLGVSQAQAFLDAALQNLIVRVSESYFGVLSAQDNLSFAKAEKEAIGRQLEQSERRFEVGLIAITDVKEAQAQFDLAVAEEIAAEIRLDQAKEDLAVITGRYYEDLSALTARMQLVRPEPAEPELWVETALEQNLSLTAQRRATEQAAEEIKRQRAGHYPTLGLNASYRDQDFSNLNGPQQAQIFDRSDTEVGISLRIPLYTGGRTSSLTRAAREDFQASQETLELTQRETVRQARNAFNAVNGGISRVQALEQALESTRASLEAAEAGFEVGTRTAVDVLLEVRQVFRAERDFAEARYAYLLDTLRLKEAAGTLTIDDLMIINSWLD